MGKDMPAATDTPRVHHQLLPNQVKYEETLSQVSTYCHTSANIHPKLKILPFRYFNMHVLVYIASPIQFYALI